MAEPEHDELPTRRRVRGSAEAGDEMKGRQTAATAGERAPVSRSPSVDKALSVLELLSEEPAGLRMIDVARALGMPKSSTYLILESLQARGYVDRDLAGAYRLGLKLFELANRLLSQLDIRQVARPHLEDLSDRTGLTTHLGILDGQDVVYVDKVDGDGFVKFDTYVGKRATVNLTALGKAMIADLPEERVDSILNATFRRGAGRSPTRPFELKEQLAGFRRSGYAIEDEEDVPGVYCVAAPIRAADAEVVAAIGVIGLKRDLPSGGFEGLGADLVAAAARVSALLGYHDQPRSRRQVADG